MLRFHRFLRCFDTAADQLRFDRHILFHAETQHQVLHPLSTEDAQEIVL